MQTTTETTHETYREAKDAVNEFWRAQVRDACHVATYGGGFRLTAIRDVDGCRYFAHDHVNSPSDTRPLD